MSPLHARLPFLPRLATTPISSGASFLAMTGLVAYGDLVTKWLAVTLWSGERYPLIRGAIGIEVVHNPLGAFSTSLGPLTREINVAATLIAVLLAMAVCSRLARIDGAAPASLGLIAGAGVGNLMSLIGSTRGVPDFLALNDGRGGALVLNLADVAAYIGIACCIRLAWMVARAAAAAPHHTALTHASSGAGAISSGRERALLRSGARARTPASCHPLVEREG